MDWGNIGRVLVDPGEVQLLGNGHQEAVHVVIKISQTSYAGFQWSLQK